MSKLIHNLHGDIGLHPAKDYVTVPKDAKASRCVVLQSSAVTGNRHVLRPFKGKASIFHWHADGLEFVSCEDNYQIIHEGGDSEHGKQKVQAGIREVRHEMEHDPFRIELRAVVD